MNILDPLGKKSTRRFNLNFINFLKKGERIMKKKRREMEKTKNVKEW